MTDFLLGQHAEAIAELKKDVAALGVKVDRVVSFVDRVDGGWKVAASALAMVGAFIGAAFAFIADYVKSRWLS